MDDKSCRFLDVSLPVNLRLPREGDRDLTLTVVIGLAASEGQPPLALTGQPGTNYAPATKSRTFHGALGPSQANVGVDVGDQHTFDELVCKVRGLSESEVVWTIESGRRELAGSYPFQLTIQQPISAFGWLTANSVPQAQHEMGVAEEAAS